MERYIKLIDVLIPAKNHKKQKQGNSFLLKHHTVIPISDLKAEMDKDFKTLLVKKCSGTSKMILESQAISL